LAAFEDALGFASERVLHAYRGESKWRERIRAGLIALLCFLDKEPAIGQLLICESLAGGARPLERRELVLVQVTSVVDEGRTLKGTGAQAASAATLPALTAEGLVGGALSVISTRLAQADHEPLVGLTNQLMSMIVLPYLGAAAARRELERPVPASRGAGREARLICDPFKDAGMRLTYRTVRVLLAIAEQGGRGISPSNRQVGEGAGIADQGQVSKLLGRLQRIGLISNAGLGPGLGAPNAWTLTAKGRELAESIRVHTENSSERAGSR
jgi:DNA-binding MarR family transcriptional regulator